MHAACCRHTPATGPSVSLNSAKKLFEAPAARLASAGQAAAFAKPSMMPLTAALVLGAYSSSAW